MSDTEIADLHREGEATAGVETKAAQRQQNRGEQQSPELQPTPFGQIFLSFLKIGAFTFGGGWAMVPLIRKELVNKQLWLEESEFMDILAIAQSGPGPIAINTSVLCGYKLRGFPGAVVATLGSSLPSFLILLVVAKFFLKIRDSRVVDAIFKGMRPAIFGLLVSAVWQVTTRSVKTKRDIFFAAAAAVLLLLLKINPMFTVLAAAIGGIIVGFQEH